MATPGTAWQGRSWLGLASTYWCSRVSTQEYAILMIVVLLVAALAPSWGVPYALGMVALATYAWRPAQVTAFARRYTRGYTYRGRHRLHD